MKQGPPQTVMNIALLLSAANVDKSLEKACLDLTASLVASGHTIVYGASGRGLMGKMGCLKL